MYTVVMWTIVIVPLPIEVGAWSMAYLLRQDVVEYYYYYAYLVTEFVCSFVTS